APAGIITNEFFAYISTRLGDPRSANDLERVTGLSTRHVRTCTLELCRKMAGDDAPGLIADPKAPRDESLVDMAVIAAQRALASAGRDAPKIDTLSEPLLQITTPFQLLPGWYNCAWDWGRYAP